MTLSIALVTLLISLPIAFIAGRVTRGVLQWRDARALRVQPRFVVAFEDGAESGEWCSFATLAEAQAAVIALNDVYNDVYGGAKRFWLQGAPRPFDAPLEAPCEVAEPIHLITIRRPRRTPPAVSVYQRNGGWFVRTGGFEIGYGAGVDGYTAALAAVERAHKKTLSDIPFLLLAWRSQHAHAQTCNPHPAHASAQR